MIKILVGSKNPVKINAAKEAFLEYFDEVEVKNFDVPSDVPVQPISSDETFRGAENRAERLKEINYKENLEFDYFVGIEGGISETYGKWFAYGCMCIINKTGKKSFGTSPHFELPDPVTKRLLQREELGYVMDEIIKTENSKVKGGAIGFFTNDVMDRKELYLGGLIVALVPFLHENLYFKK